MIRITARAAGLAAVAALAATAPPAAAAPVVDRDIALPGRPGQLALGPDGAMWVLLQDAARGEDIARVANDGSYRAWDDPDLAFGKGIAAGPDGRMWITQTQRVTRFDIDDPATRSASFPVAELTQPQRIVAMGQELWTASADKVVRIGLDGRASATTVAGLDARGIAAGGDGRLWIADFGGGRIIAFSPGGTAEPFAVGGQPQEVAAGAGGAVAFTNPLANPHEVGIVTAGAAPMRVVVPNTDPTGVTSGEDGAYWIANFASHDLSRLAPDGTVTRLGGLPALSGPRHIATATAGTLWVSLELANRVARVSGVVAPAPDVPREDPPRQDAPRQDPPRTDEPPARDIAVPSLSGLRAPRGPLRAGRAFALRLRLSEPGVVTLRVQRRAPGARRFGRARRIARRTDARNRVAIRFSKGLRPGRYRIELAARDAAGNATTLRVLRIAAVRRR